MDAEGRKRRGVLRWDDDRCGDFAPRERRDFSHLRIMDGCAGFYRGEPVQLLAVRSFVMNEA